MKPSGSLADVPQRSVQPAKMRLAFAGGGTGGHLVPGLHLLEHLRREPGALAHLAWFSSGRAIEERVLEGLPQRLAGVDCERVVLDLEPRGGGAPGLGRLAARLPAAVREARVALRRSASEAVLGLGGFACAPAILAARSLGIPAALLEINAVPGRATRVLAPLCSRVLHAWQESLPAAGRARHSCVGPPLAPRFAQPPPDERERAQAKQALGFEPSRPLLLVLGGSQGAAGLNRFVVRHLQSLTAGGAQILHQVGPGRLSEGAVDGGGYIAREYVTDVFAALTAADFVLCRGGASTVAEVVARGTPAWVVPYPHHADHHQERNARAGFRALGEPAGSCVLHEGELDEERARRLSWLLSADGCLDRARLGAGRRGPTPEAGQGASRILAELEGLVRARRWKCSRRLRSMGA